MCFDYSKALPLHFLTWGIVGGGDLSQHDTIKRTVQRCLEKLLLRVIISKFLVKLEGSIKHGFH